jgi:hypothetical protein
VFKIASFYVPVDGCAASRHAPRGGGGRGY